MTRNQWIGLGCGGAGCLGLVLLAACLGGYAYWRSLKHSEPDNDNYNFNRRANRNSNTNRSEPGSSSSMTNDGRHKLFQAASATHDRDLIKRVNEKLGLLDENSVPGEKYAKFARDHIVWIFSNTDWVSEYDTPEKGRAYVEAHIDD